LEPQAYEKLRKEAFDYMARGAGVEGTIQENRNAFNKWEIRPRVLRDVSKLDLSNSLFGSINENTNPNCSGT